MSKEIALDLTRYNTPEKLTSLSYDTASLAIEASSGNIPRVNPTYLAYKKLTDKVNVPGKDKRDVREMFVQDGSPETQAANMIVDKLKNDPKDFIYVWISPSGPWPETRIQIGAKKDNKSGRHSYIKRYDISTTISPENCLLIGQLLASVSQVPTEFPLHPDNLRGMIFKLDFPADQNPFQYLNDLIGSYIPEKDRFASILDGSADRNKVNITKTAIKVTKPIINNSYIIHSDPIGYGAYIENRMRQEGYGMNPERFGCGTSNVSFLTKSLTYSGARYLDPSIGESGDGLGPREFPCPVCGYINTRPFGGLVYRCQNPNCSKPEAVLCG